MSEELFDQRETHHATSHPRILKVDVGAYPIDHALALLRELVDHGAHPALVREALEFNTGGKVNDGLDSFASSALGTAPSGSPS
jgi:hypothetical protein